MSHEIQNNINEVRKRKGLTQAELGELVGLSQQAVQRLEKGERELRVQQAIEFARALGCSLQEIMGLDIATKLPETRMFNSRVTKTVRAMNYRGAAENPPGEHIVVPALRYTDSQGKEHEPFSVLIADDSADDEFEPGTIVSAVALDDLPADEIKNKDFVIVEDWRDGAVEVSCRQLVARDGDYYLHLRTSNLDLPREPVRWRPVVPPLAAEETQAKFEAEAESIAPGLADGAHPIALVVGEYRQRKR